MQSSLARAGKLDIRVDEDQSAKLQEIIQLLIEAGYFRAKIKGLSPFDKIVGGMTWCIEVCNFDVDVDLLFHDSLSIGQKIALTEQIVKVLPSMKCPYRIEPHQIQGLDAIHVYPVMKWLVNQAAETRAEYQDEIRIIALDEFNRQYRSSFTGLSATEEPHKASLIRKLKRKYGPKSKFKRRPGKMALTDSENVLLTVLEYTDLHNKDQVGAKGSIVECLVEGEAEDLPQTLAQTLLIDSQKSSRVSSKHVSAAISEQVKDITSTTSNFQRSRKENESADLIEMVSAFEKQKAELNMEVNHKTQQLEDKQKEEAKLKIVLDSTKQRFMELQKESQNFQTSQQTSKEDLYELGQLVEANDAAKKRIAEFKERCRKEADSLEQSIANFKSELESKECEAVDQSLLDLHSSESKRLEKFRSQLATKSREVELYKRLVDNIPGRAELAQYQRRFVELYNLVGAEHHETLQFYNMYNTLADTKFHMEKELDLLNSILDNLDPGLASSSSLAEYIAQLESIIEGLRQSRHKLDKKRSEVRAERGSLSQELSRLQELQLLYAKHIHLFSQEIARNEVLLRELHSN